MFNATILTINQSLKKHEYDGLMLFVSQEKQSRIKRFRFFYDAQNCLMGDLLTRFEIFHVTGINIKQIDFKTNEYGKPLLKNNPDIHFNISHAGNYIACVIADEPVGVDVELIECADMKIAERFFTPDEAEYVTRGQQANRFYEVWTKKESHIKWEGKGLYKPLTSVSVFKPDKRKQPIYHKILQNGEAISHVCSMKQNPPSVKMMDAAELIKGISRCSN